MLRVRAVLSYYSWLVLSLGLAAETLGLEFLGGRVELIWTLQSPSCCSFVFSRLPLALSLLQRMGWPPDTASPVFGDGIFLSS